MSNIDDSISEIKAARRKLITKVAKVALVSLLIIAFAALLYFLILTFSSSFNRDSAVVDNAVELSEGIEHSSAEANENGENQALTANPAINPAERAAIQQQLSETRQRLQQARQNQALEAWRPEQLTRLDNALESAYTLYTAADYSATRNALLNIDTQLQQLNTDFETAYTSVYQQALAAFSAGEISRARLLDREALRINPRFTPALNLQPRLDVYEEVQALWLQSNAARAENNLERESELLTALLALDSAHAQGYERAQVVQFELIERAFLEALNTAVLALDNGDLDAATAALSEAVEAGGERVEVADLRARIASERAERELAQIEQQLALFQELDEWPTVAMVASNALQKYPAHTASDQALTQATAITQSQAQLQRYIERPQRLSDLAVLRNAEEAIANAVRYQSLSAKLAAAVTELNEQIEVANEPVPIILSSDNRTFVRVLGEGNVGIHSEYTFSLKPGTYQFEGRREGYRSKIITVVVEQAAAPIRVTLICDERV
ncbi:hypothetical protein CWE08_07035 [Aliidiomarina iranensis]|uniref:PEGA domain-containing protein n=1 Tax=Aliidiomarina iranensis TaxID=1434071 RepID=A0A432VW70_9GAMM|nr:hypothetical protein [Aliidiomarina iranensis]RUO20849.1 hypothetical protein CWE08_07035 [Aliidiomarina iranensis]